MIPTVHDTTSLVSLGETLLCSDWQKYLPFSDTERFLFTPDLVNDLQSLLRSRVFLFIVRMLSLPTLVLSSLLTTFAALSTLALAFSLSRQGRRLIF